MAKRKNKRKNRALTLKGVEKQYHYYNKKLFHDALPRHVEFAIVKRKDALGECARMVEEDTGAFLHFRIEFSRELWAVQSKRLLYIVLLHEMVHIAAGLHEGHNKEFERNRERLINKGAYDSLL